MIIPRWIVTHLNTLGKYYPVISLTGPRQAGKTTLLKELYEGYRYVSFETPETKQTFEADLVYNTPAQSLLWEIKASATYHPRLTKNLDLVVKNWDSPVAKGLIYAGDTEGEVDGVQVTQWSNVEWPL